MHCTEGIECVDVFLFLKVCLVKIQSVGLYLFTRRKGNHRVVNDVVVFAEGVVTRTLNSLIRTHDWVVGHVVHF